MQHAGELAVGVAHADLEHGLVDRHAGGGRAVRDPSDLEAEHLPAHDALLDDHLEVGVDEQLGERRGRRRARAWRRGRRRLDGADRRAVRPATRWAAAGTAPTRRATTPAAASTSRCSSVEPAAIRPHQRRAEGRERVGVEEQPAGGTRRRARRRRGSRAPSPRRVTPLAAHEGARAWRSGARAPERSRDGGSGFGGSVDRGIGRVGRLGLAALAVAALEAVDAATGVHQLLLAGVEGVALAAELGA